MWDVVRAMGLTYVWLTLLGLGWAYLLVRPRERFRAAVCLAPAVGFVLTLIATYLLVRLDLPIRTWAWWWAGCGSLVSLTLFWWLRRGEPAADASERRFLLVVFGSTFLAGAVCVAPVVAGGMGYSLYRGNSWDGSFYGSMASYYQGEAYSWKLTAPWDEILPRHNAWVYTHAEFRNFPRWLSCGALGWSSCVGGAPAYRMEYASVALGFLLAVGPLLWLMRLAGVRTWVSVLVVVVTPGSYWTHTLHDVRALSHSHAVPVLSLLLVALVHIEAKLTNRRSAESLLIALSAAAVVLVYVELLPFLIAIAGLHYVATAIRARSFRWDWLVTAGLPLAVGIAVPLLLFPDLLEFLEKQRRIALDLRPVWWQAYFMYLFDKPFPGIAGVAPLAYSEGVFHLKSPWILIGAKVLGVLFCGALVAAVVYGLRRWKGGSVVAALSSVTLTCALVATAMMLMDQRWSASKAVSYAHPFSTCVVAVVVAGAAAALRRGTRPRLGTGVYAILATYLVAVLVGGLGRTAHAYDKTEFPAPVSSGVSHFRHVAPVDPVLDEVAKLGPDGIGVAVAIPEPFIAEYWINATLPFKPVNASVWPGKRNRKLELAMLYHRAELPRYVIVGQAALEAMPAKDYRLVVRQADIALVELTLDANSPPLCLWSVTGPIDNSKRVGMHLQFAVAADTTLEFPAERLFPPTQLANNPKVILTTPTGPLPEREIRPGQTIPIPLRRGLNAVKIEYVAP